MRRWSRNLSTSSCCHQLQSILLLLLPQNILLLLHHLFGGAAGTVQYRSCPSLTAAKQRKQPVRICSCHHCSLEDCWPYAGWQYCNSKMAQASPEKKYGAETVETDFFFFLIWIHLASLNSQWKQSQDTCCSAVKQRTLGWHWKTLPLSSQQTDTMSLHHANWKQSRHYVCTLLVWLAYCELLGMHQRASD